MIRLILPRMQARVGMSWILGGVIIPLSVGVGILGTIVRK